MMRSTFSGNPIQVAGIGFFHHHHPRVVSELPVQDPLPNIHGVYPGSAMLQEAIGETAGGCPQVGANKSRRDR